MGQPASALHPRQRRRSCRPVTRKSTEGLPILYLRDIPPVATGGPAIREPRIYFGEERRHVCHRQGEHAGVRLSQGQQTTPMRPTTARTASPIGGIASRTLFAWYFNDPNILLSQLHHRESRILLRRNDPGARAHDRAVPAAGPRPLSGGQRRTAVLDPGRLHDQRLVPLRASRCGAGRNYIRNSVKVIDRRLQRHRDFYRDGSCGPDRRDLPAHLSGDVQAVHGHAGRSADSISATRRTCS